MFSEIPPFVDANSTRTSCLCYPKFGIMKFVISKVYCNYFLTVLLLLYCHCCFFFYLPVTFSAQLYYTQESWVSVKKVLDRAYDLHKKKQKEHSLSKIFGEFKPLPLDGLPLFTIGPRPASLIQEVRLDYVIYAGFLFLNFPILSIVIIIGYSYYYCHHCCRFFYDIRLKVLVFY